MRVLNKVHDISPALQWYHQEYCHPGQAYVVKWYCSMEGVGGTCSALGVVLKIYFKEHWEWTKRPGSSWCILACILPPPHWDCTLLIHSCRVEDQHNYASRSCYSWSKCTLTWGHHHQACSRDWGFWQNINIAIIIFIKSYSLNPGFWMSFFW